MRCQIKVLAATLLVVALAVAQSAQAAECPPPGARATELADVSDGVVPNSTLGDNCTLNARILGNSNSLGGKLQGFSRVSSATFGPETKVWMSVLAGVGVVFLMVGRHKRRMF